ncbi:MAG: hypothetical protein ACEPOV_09440 [Hyphomicrobiales bacterium]
MHFDLTTRESYQNALNELKEYDIKNDPSTAIQLNEKEKAAERYLVNLRDQLLDKYKEEMFFPPSRYYYLSKDEMENTDLFKVLQKMPKGGLLHVHTSGTLDAMWIVERAIQEDKCYVYWGEDKVKQGMFQFAYSGKQSEGYEKASVLNETIPNFKQSLYEKLCFINAQDTNTIAYWKDFEEKFDRIRSFLAYEPVYKDYYYASFKELLDDGIQHVEIRATLFDLLQDINGNPYAPDKMIELMEQALEEARRDFDKDLTIKLIYSGIRQFDKETVRKDLQTAYRLKKEYPTMITGYDLVGEEDGGYCTRFYLDEFIDFKNSIKDKENQLPFFFHNGESSWNHNDNLFDAILLNSKRIGHGFNLFRYPHLKQLVKDKDICIEACPLSNQILGYIRDLRLHPASSYIKEGIAVTINSDDPGMFGYKGVTPDYWVAWMAWDLNLAQLKQLVWNSITYSTLDATEKEVAFVALDKRWNTFIEELTEKY